MYPNKHTVKRLQPNRRLRDRMSGGVGGRGLATPSYPIPDPRIVRGSEKAMHISLDTILILISFCGAIYMGFDRKM